MIARPVHEIARLLPPGLRAKIQRRALRIEPEAVDGIVFKVARTQPELEAAFRLAHEEYVKNWRTLPRASGLRTDLRHALPTTETIIGLEGEKVVGAVTLVGDSPFGVPMETAFGREITDLRNLHRSIVEMESIATAEMPERRRRTTVLYLIKAAVLYAKNRLLANDLVAAVQPRQRSLFGDILLFDDLGNGRRVRHPDGGSPAVGMRLGLDKLIQTWRWAYGYCPERRNMLRFYYATDKAIKLPPLDESRGLWDEDLFSYFFEFRTNPVQEGRGPLLELFRKIYPDEEANPRYAQAVSAGGPSRPATRRHIAEERCLRSNEN